MGLDGIDAAPDIHHDVDVMLDELHRVHHLVDALAGKVLEIARFEDGDDPFLNFFAEQALLVGRSDLGHSAGRLVDGFGGFEDLLRGLFGSADDGAEFTGHLRHFRAVEGLAM